MYTTVPQTGLEPARSFEPTGFKAALYTIPNTEAWSEGRDSHLQPLPPMGNALVVELPSGQRDRI